MAEEFSIWLQTAVEKHACALDKPILVVGVVGKSDANTEKYGLIDQLLEYTIFCGRYKKEQAVNIDAFYSEYHQIVFLYLNSYHDADVQQKLFDSGKPFFEALCEVEHLFIENLFVLCMITHLLIFLHPDTRGDTTILRHLISVNEMRTQRRIQLMQKLEKLASFPSTWQEEGRLALPRLLFIYRDNRALPVYSKVSSEEMNISIDRLERTREFQLVHMMKRCQIVAEHLGIALGSLTPHRVPFVHVLLPNESEVNIVNDTLSQLFRGSIVCEEAKLQLERQAINSVSLEKRLDCSKFILGHVKDIIKNEHNLPYFFLLPRFREFIEGSREVLHVATTGKIYSQELMKNWLCEEKHFIDDSVSQISFYAYEFYNYLILDEKVGPMFFDAHLSEFRHFRALEYVGAFLKVTLNESQLAVTWPKVLKQCNSRFKSRRNQCSTKSLSGVRCSLLGHKLPAEYIPDQAMEMALRGRSFIHCSGYSYFSTCGCGRSQKRRLDPFTTKEANYDFYSKFQCCAKTEVMPFNLYNPGINWDIPQTKSVVVKRRDRGRRDERRLLSRINPADSTVDATYTVVKPKSKVRIVNELLWKYNQMVHEHKEKYCDHMPHSSVSTQLPPLFPSWSVLCIGHSKLYVHKKGLSDQPGFVRGSEFLMPYDLNMTVKSEAWSKGMKEILQVDRLPWRERRNEENLTDRTHREKLKFFIGFEYECPEGHRFMIESPKKMLVHDKMTGNVSLDAGYLIGSELPLFMQCKCSNEEVPVHAQLMRLHVVTPKSPVQTKLNPLVKFDETGYFHLGTTAELNWGRYYVLRFPFIYEGPAGVVPKNQTNGVLMANCIQIHQKY